MKLHVIVKSWSELMILLAGCSIAFAGGMSQPLQAILANCSQATVGSSPGQSSPPGNAADALAACVEGRGFPVRIHAGSVQIEVGVHLQSNQTQEFLQSARKMGFELTHRATWANTFDGYVDYDKLNPLAALPGVRYLDRPLRRVPQHKEADDRSKRHNTGSGSLAPLILLGLLGLAIRKRAR